MKVLTIADIIEKRIEQADFDQLIYKVFSGSLVLYIGQSQRDIVTRFREHLNKPSKLGQLISLNLPDSLGWHIQFYSLAECRPFVFQKRLFTDQAWEHFNMSMAEKGMIEHFSPVVNVDFNSNPTPLPPHLKGHHLFGKTAVSTLLTRSSNNHSPEEIVWRNKMRLNGWVSTQDKNGRFIWKHPSGKILKEEQLNAFRESGTIPPFNKDNV